MLPRDHIPRLWGSEFQLAVLLWHLPPGFYGGLALYSIMFQHSWPVPGWPEATVKGWPEEREPTSLCVNGLWLEGTHWDLQTSLPMVCWGILKSSFSCWTQGFTETSDCSATFRAFCSLALVLPLGCSIFLSQHHSSWDSTVLPALVAGGALSSAPADSGAACRQPVRSVPLSSVALFSYFLTFLSSLFPCSLTVPKLGETHYCADRPW